VIVIEFPDEAGPTTAVAHICDAHGDVYGQSPRFSKDSVEPIIEYSGDQV